MSRLKVFLVDDHAVVRQGTRDILSADERFEVVGESGSGEALQEKLEAANPDLLLLDINLPGVNGLVLAGELKPRFPDLKIVMFTAYADLPYLKRAQSLKVDGYLSKTVSDTELREALLSARHQGPVYSGDVAALLAQQAENVLPKLTGREYEILTHLAQGGTNQHIAKTLCLSVKTVDTHVANLMKKTATHNRTQLLAYAYEHGML